MHLVILFVCAYWRFYSSWIWYHVEKVGTPQKKHTKNTTWICNTFYTKTKRRGAGKKNSLVKSFIISMKLMKLTYSSIIRKETGPFNLALNTILAYEYEYNGRIRIIIIIISNEYKLKVNKWCLYQGVFVLHVFFIISYI